MVDDAALVERLRAGDEAAFVTLVQEYHAPLLRLASTFVPFRTAAEDVVQDTWVGVLRGIDKFEGRSSLKTWMFRILVNRARTAGVRERRERPSIGTYEAAVPPERFASGGQWVDPPAPWTDDAENRILARETVAKIAALLDDLPLGQRRVVVLRDFEGLSSAEVCALLEISEANQRVLLHRGRSRIRNMLEPEIGEA